MLESGPFSYPYRAALIDRYFDARTVDPETAWQDVYRLLLWVDATTGLAHCYESDKAQPGRPWYSRSLAFHAWLADEFGVQPTALADELDQMFREVISRVADEAVAERERLTQKAAAQVAGYDREMPLPGDEPELRQIIEPLLPPDARSRPSDDVIRDTLREVRTFIATENKRKNLLGRGFEDVLHGIVRRIDGAPQPHAVGTQTPIEDIPGFRSPRSGDKSEKVDLWVSRANVRELVSAKWSVRSDREKQMRNDFLTYVACNERREPFRYVWITNEFDPARLVANATYTEANHYLFSSVVHVCPEALTVVHDLEAPKLRRSAALLRNQLEAGRIVGLADWLRLIQGPSETPR